MACEINDNINCPCTHACEKHGKCCMCVANHVSKDGFPACFFSLEGQEKYDRSFESLVLDRSNR